MINIRLKWQTVRYECMELTDENIKEKLIDFNFVKRSREYYQNCLKERDYDIK